MTSKEWYACRNPWDMIYHVRNVSERKLRLLSLACCRRAWDVFSDPRSRRAIEVAERDIEGAATAREADDAYNGANSVPAGRAAALLFTTDWDGPAKITHELCHAVANFKVGSETVIDIDTDEWDRAYSAEADAQCALVRDIFGPFRPAKFSPEWRTDTAIALARTMYEAREFSAMPILADALQDAGCDSEDILNHCRGGGPHVRGCWVTDLVLNRT